MEFDATFLIAVISFIVFVVIMNKIFYAPILKIMQENPNIVELSTNHLSVTARKIMEERVKEYETTLLYGSNGTDSSFNITEVPEIDTVGNKQKEDFVEYEDVEE